MCRSWYRSSHQVMVRLRRCRSCRALLGDRAHVLEFGGLDRHVRRPRDGPPTQMGGTDVRRQQPVTPSIAPSQTLSLAMWPASITTLMLSLVIGVGARKIASISTPFSPPDHCTAPSTSASAVPPARAQRDFASSCTQLTSVFPNGNSLRATCNAVQRCMVAVLSADRDVETLCRKAQRSRRLPCRRSRQEPRQPVVVGGQDLLHVFLCIVRLPAVREGSRRRS